MLEALAKLFPVLRTITTWVDITLRFQRNNFEPKDMFPERLDRLHRKVMILLRNAPKYVIKLNGALFDVRFVNFTVFTPNLLYSVYTVKKLKFVKLQNS